MRRIGKDVVRAALPDLVDKRAQALLILKPEELLVVLDEAIVVVRDGVWRIKENEIALVDPIEAIGKVANIERAFLRRSATSLEVLSVWDLRRMRMPNGTL